ncbi:MAG: hypothetical protein U0821_21040 [Chloroflexota bacterium]
MSCSLRDVAALEARGVPTVAYVNDVFKPIARATANLTGLNPAYLDRGVIYLKHPTSTLTAEQMTAAVDAQIDALLTALTADQLR